MGSYEFGVFVYVWTWTLLIGGVADAGMAAAAQKFIPEYAERGALAHLLHRRQPLVRHFAEQQEARGLHRQCNRLKDSGPLTFSMSTPEDTAAALDDFLTLEASGWKGDNGTAARSGKLQFFQQLGAGACFC